MTRFRQLYTMVGAAALMVGSGCGDLEVTNPNAPDVGRALASADDVKNLAISTMNSWYLTATQLHPHTATSVTADMSAANFGNFGMRFNNLEPRIAYENLSAGGDREVARVPWDFNYSTLGAANDALRAFGSGVALPTAAETAKYKNLAAFAQAASLMNLALWIDQAFIIDETFDPNGPKPELKPYTEVSATALAKWEALAAATAGNTATYTLAEIPMVGSLTGAKLNRLANTFAALTMAYTPRNATENAAVNWAKVATLAEKGIGTGSAGAPFDMVITADNNNWWSYIASYFNENSWMRVDHRLIRLMEDPQTTDAPFNGTVKPKGTSPDARYNTDYEYCQASNPAPSTGNASCQSPVIGDPGRGIYMQSNYAHRRYSYTARTTPGTRYTGPVPYILAAESNLLRAEALIRSGGSKPTAAALINNTRVGRGNLSALSGAEDNATLLAAVDYERQVELMATNGFELPRARQGLTARLQAGTFRHLPIPAKELETLGLPIYTFGGVGNEQ
ncbi:MAG: RagB/SusD family nutrient uptake outer membrane protein [Gemmatimonadaceae bacterium]|nr:RagB/SusD family nutrient uptake outer membrane protein [Gemmatimonadaceae bacterium]